ncbi:MAG: ribosome-associated translation inhibitor RaiA [Rikenellaceae bacterium]|nr:ribosome-associated translation inhibitor RaiA [Rikenellaceae bacterium]
MDIKIQSVKFDADKKLIDFVEEKVNKLSRYSDEIVAAEVFLKLDKDVENGNKVVTIKVLVKGEDLVAERRSKTFEESTDLGVDAIRKQIEKHKNKNK